MALSAQLTEALSASEAVYGFAGWITTRKKPIIASSRHDCAGWADLVSTFCDTNGLPEPRHDWTKDLTHPRERLRVSEQLAAAMADVVLSDE